MFNLFKKKNKYPDSNEMVVAMSQFLINDTGSDLPTPFKEFLDPTKLDFSIESLLVVDSYLSKVFKHKNELNHDQFIKVVARCGTYCGEVVRKNSNGNLYWITFDTAVLINQKIEDFGKSVGGAFILFEEPDRFLFPLAKVVKFLENGEGDSLWGFAKMALSK